MATFEELSSALPTEAEQTQWEKLMALGDQLPVEGQEAKGKGFFPEAEIALTRGAIGTTGDILRGESARQAATQREIVQQGVVRDVMEELGLEPLKPFTPEQKEKFAARVKEKMAAIPIEDFTKTKTYQTGEDIRKYAEKNYKNAKDYENGLTSQFMEGLASSGVMIAPAILNIGAGFETGVALSASEAMDKATQAGATKEQILQAVNKSFFPGATEMAPVEVLFNAMPFKKWAPFAKVLFKWGATALAEGGQEGFQQWMQNLIAKWTYKPDQSLSEGVAAATALGTAIGATFGAAGTITEVGGEEPAPDRGIVPPGARGAVPPGAVPAETIIPGEPPPPGGGPPAAVPTAPLTELKVFDQPANPEEAAINAALDQQVADAIAAPDSPRLTESDRRSPIPNDLQDEGKRAVEGATGKESTFTTTKVIDGKREVVTGNVSDLVAGNRVEAQTVVAEIMRGVSQPEILAGAPETALPVSAAAAPATVAPTEAPAAVEPAIATPEAAAPAPVSPAVAEARAPPPGPKPIDELTRRFRAHTAAFDAEVADLASSGQSIRMERNDDPSHKAIIGPDMSEPGMFRVTWMDKDGPSGHTQHRTMEEAAQQVVGRYHKIGEIAKDVIRGDTAFTPGGREIPVTYAVVEAGDLVTSQRDEGGPNPAYPQELQPRDRSRGTSDQQINSIAQNLNPALLDNNASASDGAPIVSADGVVESGNGRILAVRRAYNQGLATAEAYREYLVNQGYLDRVDAKRMKNPVLVRIRQGQMEPGERAALTREANERTTLAMSATERAMADAAAMSPETMGLYRGGEIAEAGNRDFVRGFMQSVVNPNEQAAMVTPDGGLSQEAIRRVQGALLAKAYGDADLVGALLESPDTNIKAIGGALMDVAGLWAQMRTEAKDGAISPDADATERLLEAVRLVQRARAEGRPLSEYVAQKDIFSGDTIHPEAESMLRLMFRNDRSWTMPAGREKLAEALRFYATEARKTTAGVNMFGEAATPAKEILAEAKRRQYGGEEAVQPTLPGAGRPAGKDVGKPSEGRAVEAKPRLEAAGRPEAPRQAESAAKAPAEVKPEPAAQAALKEKVEAKRGTTEPQAIDEIGKAADQIAEINARIGQLPKTQTRAIEAAKRDIAAIETKIRERLATFPKERHSAILAAAHQQATKVRESAIAAERKTAAEAPAALVADIGRLLSEGKTPNEIRAALRDRIAAVAGDSALAQRVLITRVRDAVAAKAAKEGLPAPKFSKRKKGMLPFTWDKDFVWDEKLEPGPRRLSKEEQREADALEKRLSSEEISNAVAEMEAQPRTDELPGYGTDEFWANRLYEWGKAGKIGFDETIRRLVRGARTLAVDEINDSRKFANKERAEQGLPPLEMLNDYEVENGYRGVILMGPPGAGKSSIANPMAVRMKAAISDVDEAKKVIPGYNKGIGANAVHEESSFLGQRITNALLANGSNIIIPTVGTEHKKIEALRQMLVRAGYKVELHIMDPGPTTSVGRMLKRFDITGRLIPPAYFLDAVWQPPHIFRAAQRLGRFDAYARVTSNDISGTRVSEASGKAPLLARGEEFDRTGTIRPGRDDKYTGRRERSTQIQGEPEGSEKLHQPHEPNLPKAKFKLGEARTQTRRTTAGTLSYQTTDAFVPHAAQFLKDFRKILDRYGLKDVKLDVWGDILIDGKEPIEGLYLPELIEVALKEGQPETTLHHEVIHALFDLALTIKEKAILLRKSHKDWITDQIKHDYSEFDRATQAEEGVAHAYTAWRDGEKNDGIITKSFKKISTFLKGLYQALTGHDIRNVEDIFRQIESGKIGRRTQAGKGFEIIPGGMPGEEPLYAKGFSTEVVDLFEGPREQLVIPGAEKLTDAQMAQRKADAKLQATKGQRGTEGLPLFGDESKQLALFKKGAASDQPGRSVKERIDNAIGEINSTLFRNPLNNAEVGFANKEQTAAVMMQVENYGDSLYVKWLSAYPQKSGMGTRGMKFLQDIATKHDVPLTLTPWKRGELGEKKLTKIFKGWGFEMGKGGLLRWTPDAAVAKFSKKPSGPNDPRFKLKAPPATSQQAQQTAQGFLNRGQPVDRALRMPFELLGGIDDQGRWQIGKRLSDKMKPAGRQGFGIGGVLGAGVGTFVGGPVGGFAGFFAGGSVGAYILGSSPKPNGKFAWFHGLAEHAKRGLVDGYGLDPEYIEAYRKSELGKAAIMREAQGVMKVLSNAGVGTPEAKVLQAVLTGENVTDQDMIKLAVPIRKAIDDMGAEAVSLGLISAESFDRNRGSYLHRIYTKNEVDQSTLAGWVSAKMANRRKRIIGDQLKGRGMFMDVAGDRLMKDVASFQQGARGAAVLGEKFHVIDEVSTIANLQPGGKPTEKTLRRVYLPANEAVPAKYQGASWVDRGQWEVRQAGKEPTLWRDYTKAERDSMGELVDARYTIAKTFMLMANDLSTGRFFKEVSEKQEWTASMPPPEGQWKEASEYGRYWEDNSIRWVKVPDTSIQGTGGKKRWGALAGKFVRSEIWRDLNEVDIASRPGTWRILLTQWKKNHTGRHPGVHMNNIMSNVVFMDLADVRMQDLHAGIKAFATGDANYQEALDNGAFGGDMVSQEIRDEVFKPILDEIAKQTTGAGNPFLKRAGMLGVFADALWTKAKQFDNGMLRAYQAEDQLFRMATYMRRRSQGESPQVAAMNARDQFLNYDIRAPWVVLARNTAFPFISYTYRAVPKLAENILHRPWKLAKYAAIAYAVNALAYLWDDGDDDEERERASLRDEEQGYTWLGTPRMLRMPWRDAHGLPVFFDIRRWVPAGDIFDANQGSSALPIPAPLRFGGPMQMAFEFMLNRQAFTGDDITNSLTMDNMEKFSAVSDWAWKGWMPSSFWTPRSWYWTKIGNALYGATDTAGHPYSVPQALLSSIGVKVKPVDVNDGIKWHMFDFMQVQTALKAEMRSLAGQLERGLISQSAFDSGAANIMSKFENLGQNVQEFSKRAAKKK